MILLRHLLRLPPLIAPDTPCRRFRARCQLMPPVYASAAAMLRDGRRLRIAAVYDGYYDFHSYAATSYVDIA